MRSIPFAVDDLMQKIQKISFSPINSGSDEFRWGLTKNGIFLVDSMYKALIEHVQPILNKAIWKI
jgi:hypothetical protein